MFVNVGYNNFVNVDKIVSITGYGSASSKRVCRDAAKVSALVDTGEGNKCRSVIVTETHVIKSAFEPETIVKRIGE